MPKFEVSLSDQTDTEIDRLVAQDEFVTREQAVEELLTLAMSSYNTTTDTTEPEQDLFTQAIDDQQDPAMRNDLDDGYSF